MTIMELPVRRLARQTDAQRRGIQSTVEGLRGIATTHGGYRPPGAQRVTTAPNYFTPVPDWKDASRNKGYPWHQKGVPLSKILPKVLGDGLVKALPKMPYLDLLINIYELWQLTNDPTWLNGPAGRASDDWKFFGGSKICGTSGSPVMVGDGAIHTCGAGSLHLKTWSQKWRWFAGSGWRIIGIPDINWVFDANYWDSRPNRIIEQWGHPNPIGTPPPNVEKKPAWFPSPFDDPGPAPVPHRRTQPNPAEFPWVFPPGHRPPSFAPPVYRVEVNPFSESQGGPPPGQRINAGNTVPTRAPTVIFNVPGKTRLSKKPHSRARPKPREREKKTAGLIQAGSFVGRALNTVTESADALYAFYDAIHWKCRLSRKGRGPGALGRIGSKSTAKRSHRFIRRPPPHEAIARIAQCIATGKGLDVEKALINLAQNQVEDFIIGKTAGKAGKALGGVSHKYLPGSSGARSPLTGFTGFSGR